MTNELSWHERVFLKGAVKEKCRNLKKQGYNGIEEGDFWEYLLVYRWPKSQVTSLTQKKADISCVTSNDFFDYQRIKAQVSPKTTFSWEDIHDLL